MVPQYRPVRDSGVASTTDQSDLQMLHDLRFDYPKKLLYGSLNINSLRNKVPIDYFVISETKLENSFPNAQLAINNYEIRARRDGNKHGGGLIGFVRKGIICSKRLRKYEALNIKVICSEVTILSKNSVIFNIYRPPD